MVKYLGFTRQDHRGFDLEMTCCFLFFSKKYGIITGNHQQKNGNCKGIDHQKFGE